MANWFEKQRSRIARSLHADAPPVTVISTSSSALPRSDFVHASVYQSGKSRCEGCIHAAVSPDRSIFHLIATSSNHEKPSAQAIARASRQAWLEVSMRQEVGDWNLSKKIIESHLSHLKSLLIDVSRSSLDFDYVGISINRKCDEIHVESSANCTVLVIPTSGQFQTVKRRVNSCEGRYMDQSEVIKASGTKAIVLTHGPSNSEALKAATETFVGFPYPLAGAAELTHFAMLERGVISDVTWIEILPTV